MSPPAHPLFSPQSSPLPARTVLRAREERLQSLKQLAGQLAHDFNNFLVPILGYLALIREDLDPASPPQGYAATMEASVRKTERTLDAALLATRPQRRFRPKPVDLAELVGEELDQWIATVPLTARISVKRDLTSCPSVLDAAQWRGVIQQLLHNARFALATGGTLEVSLRPQTLAAGQAADLGVAGTATSHLVVRDSGFGMPTSVLERAFDPFFSTRNKSQGLGLGLTIVHSVVRLHGGQVLIESAEDAGTTVTIWVPSTQTNQEAPGPPPAVPRSATPPARRPPGSKVLLVEDDVLVLEVIRACLQRAQFEVHTARNGQEGLDLYRRFPGQWSLVLTDLAMPVMNGITMVQQIRQLEPDAEVILVSGDFEAASEKSLARLGQPTPTLIKKPFTLKGLMEAVRTHLGDHSIGSVSKKPCN